MINPRHGYLTEPEWFARNAPDSGADNWMVWIVVAAIVAFAGWMMTDFTTGGAP